MRLVDVYRERASETILYELLSERPSYAWISHGKMPSMGEHRVFVHGRPFRYWYLIESPSEEFVGAIEATENNEIGVHILKRHQRRGYGAEAMKLFLRTHKPLAPVKAKRNGRWLVNIAVGNEEAKVFFKRLNFKPLQETYVL